MQSRSLPAVMIVDDDPLFRLLTRLLLENHGVSVSVAEGCSEALELLPTAKPGLALIDMVMPEKDGIATIEALRGVESDLRFVACSGHDHALFRDELTRIGVSHFLPKPFSVEQLMEKLRASFDGRAA